MARAASCVYKTSNLMWFVFLGDFIDHDQECLEMHHKSFPISKLQFSCHVTRLQAVSQVLGKTSRYWSTHLSLRPIRRTFSSFHLRPSFREPMESESTGFEIKKSRSSCPGQFAHHHSDAGECHLSMAITSLFLGLAHPAERIIRRYIQIE